MAQELSPRLHQRHTAARLAIDPPIMTSEQARRWRPHRSGRCRYRHYARSFQRLRGVPQGGDRNCVKELIRTLKAMIA